MNFSASKLPSSMREIGRHWKLCIQERFNLSRIDIKGKNTDFNLPSDYFELSDREADKISLIGRKYDFELIIFGDVSFDTQIGGLLGNIKHKRPTVDVYGLFVKYK